MNLEAVKTLISKGKSLGKYFEGNYLETAISV